jgi:pyridoxamine 5'-phosphate oxidase
MDPAPSPLDPLRERITRTELSEHASQADPLAQFRQWLEDANAAQVLGSHHMTLATVSADMRPSTRVVLYTGADERGIVWYTNYESRKGEELAGNPWAALQFHWPELERMVRIEGRVGKTSAEESDAYYARRPLDMRIGAWASPQSRVIGGTAQIVASAARYGAQFLLKPPRPPHWGGFRLQPDQWQFWQGRASKLHDRLRYRPEGAGWVRDRLAP